MSRLHRNRFSAAILAGVALALAWWAAPRDLPAQAPRHALTALDSGEKLKFRLLWPSGVGLGEAVMSASAGGDKEQFEMTVEAELPVRNFSGTFSAVATRADLCSVQYHRKVYEGTKTSEEIIEFDQSAHEARRTVDGRTSSSPVAPCARDPLTFLYYFRDQLAAAHRPDAASFFLGQDHSLEVAPAGSGQVSVQGHSRSAGKYSVTYQGGHGPKTFEVWFAADAAHEPVLVRLPTPLAVFSAELE